MRKKPKRRDLKAPGKCIFCAKHGGLSKEHIWPDWSAELFTKTSAPAHEEFMIRFTEKVKLVEPPKIQSRQGGVTTKKLRVVCQDCNNGWMSSLEDAARSVLTTLMLGKPTAIKRGDQELLAQWIAVKVMVSEQNVPSDAISRQEDRTAMMLHRKIPPYLSVWIAHCLSQKWESAYLRHAGTMGNTPVPPPNARKNVQSCAFGFKHLFVYTLGSTADGLDLNEYISIDRRIPKLWPFQGEPITWPTVITLNDRYADEMATALDRLIKSPRMLWRPFPT